MRLVVVLSFGGLVLGDGCKVCVDGCVEGGGEYTYIDVVKESRV